MGRRSLTTVVGLLCLLAVLVVGTVSCGAATPSPAPRPGLSSELREAVTVEGIMEHERRFAAIAEENGGNRAAGTPGYDASAAYVADALRDAGYNVAVQRFRIPASQELRTAELEITRPEGAPLAQNTDFVPVERSGAGEAEARVRPVDAGIEEGGPADSSTSGCEAGDFAAFSEGEIALLRRGTCTFGEKAHNAEEAGASAVVIFNEGQPGGRGLLRGTLGGSTSGVPVVGTTAAVGERLIRLSRSGGATGSALGGATVRVSVAPASGTVETSNVIAETPSGDGENVVMLGAHLDSVPAGPGINDNGSGSATILETALRLAEAEDPPRNGVRFAFWGAEELGLLGSTFYVEGLEEGEVENISAYLNFDMVGSPNFVREVYDGTDETEGVFTDYFGEKGIEVDVNSALDGRSDHGPFADRGVPTGGLFSGAEQAKTAEEAEAFGGEAGVAHDACYHKACDDLDNLDKEALDQFSDAAAHATAAFAQAKD